MQLDALIHKADVLIEALPYIVDFRGETVVVKLGGSVMESPDALVGILTDVAFMRSVGMRVIVVHGGGKAISRALKEAGLGTTFVQGLRVTDAASIRIVEDVIKNEVNAEIVRCTARASSSRTARPARTPPRAPRWTGGSSARPCPSTPAPCASCCARRSCLSCARSAAARTARSTT